MKYVKYMAFLFLTIVTFGFSELIVTKLSTGEKPTGELKKDSGSISLKIKKTESMTASWYGPKFHGKKTANGEVYDQMAFTAAHKYLPFGTMLRVTNPENGKTAIVRINDRGPYIDGRDIDLSKGVANALGMTEKGVIEVDVEKIVPDQPLLPIEALN